MTAKLLQSEDTDTQLDKSVSQSKADSLLDEAVDQSQSGSILNNEESYCENKLLNENGVFRIWELQNHRQFFFKKGNIIMIKRYKLRNFVTPQNRLEVFLWGAFDIYILYTFQNFSLNQKILMRYDLQFFCR